MRFPHRIRKKSIAYDRKSLSAKLKGRKSNLDENWQQKVMKNCLLLLTYIEKISKFAKKPIIFISPRTTKYTKSCVKLNLNWKITELLKCDIHSSNVFDRVMRLYLCAYTRYAFYYHQTYFYYFWAFLSVFYAE